MSYFESNENLDELFSNTKVNINGLITSPEEAKISIFDRGFLYGDSVYEVTMFENNSVLDLHEHMERLWNSAELISMELSIPKDVIISELNKTIKSIDAKRKYIRIIITRGQGDIGLAPSNKSNNLVIICREISKNPNWWYEKGVDFIISNIIRNDKESLDPNAKSGNYLNSVMAYLEAKSCGAFDSVMVNKNGEVTEGTTNNIWMIKDGLVYTPPLKVGILKGITREKVLKICHSNEIQAQEKVILPEELLNADECFFTSSTKGIVPITKLNEKLIGTGVPGPVTQNLMSLYKDSIEQYAKNNPFN